MTRVRVPCDLCGRTFERQGLHVHRRWCAQRGAECAVAACSRPIEARGLCNRHYQAWYAGRLDVDVARLNERATICPPERVLARELHPGDRVATRRLRNDAPDRDHTITVGRVVPAPPDGLIVTLDGRHCRVRPTTRFVRVARADPTTRTPT